MKKRLLLSLFILSLTAFTIQAQTVQVTFQVDMTGVEVDPTGVYIAGGTVQPDNNVGLAMSDVNNDNIWTLTTSVPTNTLYLFKYRNRATTGEGDWDGFEEPDPLKIGGCTEGHYHDRFINVGVSDIVLDIVKYGSCDNNDAASTNHLGCLDSKATDYKPSATEQQYDNNGNVMCNYASCADIPAPGCIYETDGVYGAFVDGGFSAGECEGYGGTACQDGGDQTVDGGCMDSNASNYDASATTQGIDVNGNILCIYASCDKVPYDGCRYAESFGKFEDQGFSAAQCTEYGGTPCEDGGNQTVDGGCIDSKASNYDSSATTQAMDLNGNVMCDYDSCNDIPTPGCIYETDGVFGAFVDGGFSAAQCTEYGGTPCATVGILETQTSVATIFPNPANNFIAITDLDFTNVEIHNLTGQIVQVNNNSKVIEISTLPIGVYTLKITDINGDLYHSKLIKK